MGELIALKTPNEKNKRISNRDVIKNQKKQDLLKQAFDKAEKTSGIDYYKVLSNDEKEVQRLRMRQHQERMNLY